jgi:2-oxoglutarate dehydrogenase E1 component
LQEITKTLTTVPEGFKIHPKLEKWLQARSASLENGAIDWAFGEALAIGSLLLEGRTVRMAGQDTRRGTFSQRHTTLADQQDGSEYTPLHNLPGSSAPFYVYDSLLSEFAALGFEYGYSVSDPDALVMWEAQFGDFVNGAQIIIDQYLAAAADKWDQTSSLVMLLPHGYEGQGPEHSSARLERFLQLAGKDNFRIVSASTPAQFFHLLRRQALNTEIRRPLVAMSPKSFLRLPAARSKAEEMTKGHFDWVLGDPAEPEEVRRVVLCTGKFFYDLHARREKGSSEGVALVRIEQLYPFPTDAITKELERYPGAQVVWAQEEPANMGAWRFMDEMARAELDLDLVGIVRPAGASPATGSFTTHQWEQDRLLDEALSAPAAKKTAKDKSA